MANVIILGHPVSALETPDNFTNDLLNSLSLYNKQIIPLYRTCNETGHIICFKFSLLENRGNRAWGIGMSQGWSSDSQNICSGSKSQVLT